MKVVVEDEQAYDLQVAEAMLKPVKAHPTNKDKDKDINANTNMDNLKYGKTQK
jgi:hypothetical protein